MAFNSPFRSPTDPFLRSVEMEAAVREAIEFVVGADYFSRDENIRLASMRSLNGLGGRLNLNLTERALSEDLVADMVRRINLVVSLANGMVKCYMLYAEIHPKIQENGQYPRDFDRARRVEEFFAMDGVTIDRLLQSYGLPRDMSSVRRQGSLMPGSLLGGDRFGVASAREAKIITLFQYLGVDLGARFGGRDRLLS